MQLTCTLAIFACLIVADAAACNLSTGTGRSPSLPFRQRRRAMPCARRRWRWSA